MEVERVKTVTDKISENISKVIVGKEKLIDLVLTAILAGGHVLIEDNPGTGKTMLAKAFAKSISGDFRRVQFTPDLMPSDITGLNIYNQKTSEFEFVKGPVFTNVLLADEINRATPRTQSGLLEAMEEEQVTIDGELLNLNSPFIVLATENPIETVGTYPLPEAQLDRFIMKLEMGETDKAQELDIIERYIAGTPIKELKPVCTTEDIMTARELVKRVYVHNCVRDYIVNIIFATRTNTKFAAGVSARGTLALVKCSQAYAAIKGRGYVEPDDVIAVAPYVLGHRVMTLGGNTYRGNIDTIREIVGTIQVPVEDWEK